MKHKKFNKPISVLLLLVMVLGLFPTTAYGASDTNTVTITYDKNGGQIGPGFNSSVQVTKGKTLTFSEPESFVISAPRNQKFAGVEIDGVVYSPNSKYTVTKDVTIKYLWKENTDEYVTVTYDKNGGIDGPMFSNPVQTIKGSTLVFSTPEPSVISAPDSNKRFAGVEIDSVFYPPNSEYTVTKNITVKYIWETIDKDFVTLTFDSNGGTKGPKFMDSYKCHTGELIISAPEDDYLKAPEGKIFSAVQIDGFFLPEGSKYTITKDATVKYLWCNDPNIKATVTFDPNGGIKGLDYSDTYEATVGEEIAFTKPAYEFIKTPEGKKFAGVEIDGIFYPPNSKYTVTKDIYVKFIWEDISTTPVTITYDVNGGTKGVNFNKTSSINKNTKIQVPESLPEEFAIAPENMEYKGVEIGDKEYKPGETYKVENNITIKLLWKEKELPKPTDPTKPTDPVNPTDPTKPTDPVNPADPAKPVDPTKPADPVNPADPTKPVDPVKPADPVNPADPVKPVDPTKPADPVNPVDPTKPADPVNPVDPTKPADPVNPVNPAKPADSVKPANPVDSVKPANPVDSVKPTDSAKSPYPVDSAKPSNAAPQTSDHINVSMWITLLLISMCSVTFIIYRKKKEI